MNLVSAAARPLERAVSLVGLLLVLVTMGCAASASMSTDYPGAPPEPAYDGSSAPAAEMPAAAQAMAVTGGGAESVAMAPPSAPSPGAPPSPSPAMGAPGAPAAPAGGAGPSGTDPRAPIGGGTDDKGGEPPDSRGAKQADPATPKPLEPRPTVAQMLIYTADVGLQVEQGGFPSTIDRVVDLAIGMGGYVASHDNTTVQVRVPSLRFRDALKEIEKLGIVVNRSVNAQDVSEEFHDLEIRLKSLKATRDRLEQFLTRAKDIQEVLAVERELSRVNTEIDRIEGRMRYLAARAAFSTITVHLQPKAKTVVIDEPTGAVPPPPPRTIPLPVPWLPAVGLDRLLQLDVP
jgi:hypothetical protein